MSLRMTVVAALGVGVLAAPCGGFNANTLGQGADMAVKGYGAKKEADVECKKLEVEPAVKEEYALGGALAINFVQRGGGLLFDTAEDKKLHEYVNVVGRNLAAQSLRPTLVWTFGVLKEPKQFNAMSAPGGYVFVTRRLLEKLDNEGQLAGVLAHEIAHVVLKHAIHQYNAQKVATCTRAMVGEALLEAGPLAALTAGLKGDGTLDLDGEPGLLDKLAEGTLSRFDKGNSKEMEHEADRMAAQLLVSAGYDPEDYRRLLAKTDEDTAAPNHPTKVERVKKLVTHLGTLKQSAEGEFPELATEGLRSPPLKQPDYAVIRPATGVAKDGAK